MVFEQVSNGELIISGFDLDGSDGDINGCKDQIYHDTAPEIHHGHVEFVRALRSIPQGEHETREKGGKVQPLEDDTQPLAGFPEKILVAKRGSEDTEDQKEVTLKCH